MRKNLKRWMCMVAALMLALTGAALAENDGQMSAPPDGGNMGTPPSGGPGGEMGTPPSGGPGGEMGTPPGGGMDESVNSGAQNATNTTGEIAIDGEEVTVSDEYADAAEITVSDGKVVISGLTAESGDYSETIVSATGDADVTIANAKITLDVSESTDGSETPGEAVYTDSGILHIEDSEITVNGAGRYTIAAEGTATMVVNDSVITAGGDLATGGNTSAVSEPTSNAGLLISGTSRANFSVGATDTYYYNSLCVTEGWAALSTDSATGDGLDFTGYLTEAIALHGGYGIYADTNCRDALYGTTIVSAEVGAIISNNGSITMTDSDSADESTLSELTGETAQENTRSTVIAGRNDFQLHSPDMMGEGNSDYTASLTLSHTDLITDESINADGLNYTSEVNGETYTVQATEDYTEKYGEAIGAYIEHVTGSAILIKSTSAEITLDDVTITPSNGVAIHSILNSDSMSRYLKQDVGAGVNVNAKDSTITGDILHEDYQRDLNVTLDGSTLTGAVIAVSAEEWNESWAEYADDENACWVNLDSSTYVTENHATSLSLTNGSVWQVTAESSLSALYVDETSSVEGTVWVDGEEVSIDGEVNLTGNIIVKPAE